VTEYNVFKAVPVLPHGDAGPASGSPGRYDVIFVLGVPGVGTVATNLDWDSIASRGDSLLEGTGLQIELLNPDSGATHVAQIVPNRGGHLAQVRLMVTGQDFASAEREAHNEVMSLLSRIAFEVDTPLEVVAVLMTEQATQTRSMGATVVGSVQPAPECAGLMTPELRPFLAAYREGLNSNSPLYQALSFYKVIEGVDSFGKNRRRAEARAAQSVSPDPMDTAIPAGPELLPDATQWAQEAFTPFLGKTFTEIKSSVEKTVRNAVVHLSPGQAVRVADYLQDIEACREITPILRYMARSLIRTELSALSS
jgi:hypothetical protein